MRKGRLKLPAGLGPAYYHCISRVVDRQMLFGPEEKQKFVSFLFEYTQFCEVRLVTYCIMTNHFHILVEVPPPPEEMPDDEALSKKLETLSGIKRAGKFRQDLERFRERKQHKAAEALRGKVLCRMWDISNFMKELKQRFTQWYNRGKKRKGTLWEERFKSVLVESAGETLATMAAYIDLNPVRANLVDDPGQFPYCGYAAALAGNKEVLGGLAKALPPGFEDVLAAYRLLLFAQGEMNEGIDEQGRPPRRGFTSEEVAQVMAAKGKLPLHDYLRLRVRYFCDGAVVGRRPFVNEVFKQFRDRFGRKRKDGARKMKYLAPEEFYSMRDLRVNVLQCRRE